MTPHSDSPATPEAPTAWPRRTVVCAAAALTAVPLVTLAPSAEAAGTRLVRVRDVPRGGGVILNHRQVVVTKTVRKVIHVFSSICTHQGCQVGEVADHRIHCICHGSEFAISDGRATQGPAVDPLPKVAFEIRNGWVHLAAE